MKTLYIDCFAGFTTEMLLGALIDMGASADYICAELKESGLTVTVERSAAIRGGMDCTLARVKCAEDDSAVREKLGISLESLCALCPDATAAQLCAWAAVMIAAESFGASGFACSLLSDGHGIDSDSGAPVPSPFVMNLLQKCGAPIRTVDIERELISDEGMAYLASSVKSFRLMPSGTILCTGYGAGSVDLNTVPYLVRTVLIDTDEGADFLTEFHLDIPITDSIGGLA